MKKWRITKAITIIILIVFFIRIVLDAINCMKLKYPHPMLGVDSNNWVEQFQVDMLFLILIWGIPIAIDVIILIISIRKIKKEGCEDKFFK